MNPWIAMAVVMTALAGVLTVAGHLIRRGILSAEEGRKAVHLTLGLLSMGFPLIFRAAWPVWILATASMLALAVVRLLRPIHAPARQALHGVARESYGEFCFPLAVALVFSISAHNTSIYLLAIATLTFADSAGALVGRRYGRHAYQTDEGTKTIEGSLAVMVTTSMAALILLPDSMPASWLNRIMMAALLGLLITLIEAVALRGFDNLFIPLLSVALVDRFRLLTTEGLMARLALLLLIVWLMLFMRRGTRLNDTALIGCSVLIYLAAFAADWIWTLAPILTLIAYKWLIRVSNSRMIHTLGATSAALAPGYFWLMVHMIRPSGNEFTCYQLAFVISVSLMAISEWSDHASLLKRRLIAAATLGTFIMIPALFVTDENAALLLAGSWVLGFAASLLFMRVEWQREIDHGRDRRWLLQGGISLAFSYLGVLL